MNKQDDINTNEDIFDESSEVLLRRLANVIIDGFLEEEKYAYNNNNTR